MLESRLLDDATRPTELASAEFAFVIDAGGPYVVIERSSAQPSKLELLIHDAPDHTRLISPDGQELRSLSVPDRDCPC